jgi:hypothetical protein
MNRDKAIQRHDRAVWRSIYREGALWIAAGVLLIGVTGVLQGCGGQAQEKTADTSQALTIPALTYSALLLAGSSDIVNGVAVPLGIGANPVGIGNRLILLDTVKGDNTHQTEIDWTVIPDIGQPSTAWTAITQVQYVHDPTICIWGANADGSTPVLGSAVVLGACGSVHAELDTQQGVIRPLANGNLCVQFNVNTQFGAATWGNWAGNACSPLLGVGMQTAIITTDVDFNTGRLEYGTNRLNGARGPYEMLEAASSATCQGSGGLESRVMCNPSSQEIFLSWPRADGRVYLSHAVGTSYATAPAAVYESLSNGGLIKELATSSATCASWAVGGMIPLDLILDVDCGMWLQDGASELGTGTPTTAWFAYHQ